MQIRNAKISLTCMKTEVKISKLSNGMTLVFDKMTEIDSVIVQIAVPAGSQNELREEGGISHFLEHMAFKGTEKRSYKDISEAVDNVGGLTNAFTSKDWTSYFIKVLKKDMELPFDILSDMLFCSSFPKEEIEKERGVILQEKAMYEDDPSSVNEDLFYLKGFGDTAFGRSIIGTSENIKRFTRDDFINYRAKNYKINEMVIGVCGNADEEEVKQLAEKYFGYHKIENQDYKKENVKYIGGAEIKFKEDLEQIKFTLGLQGVSHKNLKEYYAMSLASKILGRGMSSRLFQEIREKRGLVYFVHSNTEIFSDTTLFTIDAGFSPEKIHEFAPALKNEVLTICDYIKDEEMDRCKNQLKSSLLMSLERCSGRVMSNISDMLLYGRVIEQDEILKTVDTLSKQDLINTMNVVFSQKPTLAVYGDVKKENANILLNTFNTMK